MVQLTPNFVTSCLLLLSYLDLKREDKNVMVLVRMGNGWLTGLKWYWKRSMIRGFPFELSKTCNHVKIERRLQSSRKVELKL